jgi:hypothetical protein
MILEQITPKKRLNIRTGDIFAYKLVHESFYRVGYLFEKDATVGVLEGCTILQLFTTTINSLEEKPLLEPNDFLCPPIIDMCYTWREGYFQNIQRKVELNGRKTFYFFHRSSRKYHDNHGNSFEEIPENDYPESLIGDSAGYSHTGISSVIEKHLP